MRSDPANPARRRVAVLAFDGLSMFEFAVAVHVFGSHDGPELTDWYDTVVCAVSNEVRMDNGLTMQVPRRLASLRAADTVVVPPCDDADAVPEAVLTALRRAHARGTRILSLCTGAFVLARAGLLDGRRAVTHWAECDRFADAFPSITVEPSALYIDDGDILTSAGSAASIDLCLHIVRLDHGAEVAGRLARSMVVQPHRDGGQAQYIETPMPAANGPGPLSNILSWMAEHLDEPMTVVDLARRASMSPRSFARHFSSTTGSTPHRWLVVRRIGFAQQLLETSDLSVDVVAERTGLGNAANLRKHFARQVGTSPSAYRRSFGRTGEAMPNPTKVAPGFGPRGQHCRPIGDEFCAAHRSE